MSTVRKSVSGDTSTGGPERRRETYFGTGVHVTRPEKGISQQFKGFRQASIRGLSFDSIVQSSRLEDHHRSRVVRAGWK